MNRTRVTTARVALVVVVAVAVNGRGEAAVATEAPRLAFAASSYRHIDVVDLATGEYEVVVRADVNHSVVDPSWDPSGRRIAFGETFGIAEPFVGELRIVDTDSRRVTTVLVLPTLFVSEVAWSPRGDRIAFSTSTAWTPIWGLAVSHRSVHIVDVDGTDHLVLGAGTSPSWSPDGTRLAFAAASDIVVLEPDDVASARTIGTPLIAEGSPRWAPDGRRLAFTSARALGEPWITIAVVDTGELVHLPVTTWSPPTWSPDGTRVAYADRGVVTINVQTGLRHRLSFDEDSDSHAPAWSTSGTIAFHRWSSVDSIDPATAQQRILVRTGASPWLAWSR